MTLLGGPIANSIRYKSTFVASIGNRVNNASFGYEWISECLYVRIGWDIALLSSIPLFKLPKFKRRFTPPFPLFFFIFIRLSFSSGQLLCIQNICNDTANLFLGDYINTPAMHFTFMLQVNQPFGFLLLFLTCFTVDF